MNRPADAFWHEIQSVISKHVNVGIEQRCYFLVAIAAQIGFLSAPDETQVYSMVTAATQTGKENAENTRKLEDYYKEGF